MFLITLLHAHPQSKFTMVEAKVNTRRGNPRQAAAANIKKAKAEAAAKAAAKKAARAATTRKKAKADATPKERRQSSSQAPDKNAKRKREEGKQSVLAAVC